MQDGIQGYVSHEGCDHVFFIGFLGAGKSTLARNLGRLFHRPYVDTDTLVERDLHSTVARIFAEQGEPVFRDAETQALRRLESESSLLVSCGGGIVERPENAVLMHQMGTIVYLKGDLDDSLRQIRHPEKRPDLGDRSHAAIVFSRRQPLYVGCCDLTVSITGRTFSEVADATASLLWEKGLL